jgi:hypothetical protein
MFNIKILVWRFTGLVTCVALFGCAGNGYITSGVNTVVGLDVSENPKTQVPHVRFGYVRSQLYYVPTGKTETTSGQTASSSGRADETPVVVSEIFVNSKFLSDITISEKFAIGNTAVQSGAANATFSIPAAQAVASNSGVDVAAVATARTAALNRAVREPVGLTHDQFQEFIKKFQAPSKPEANLPTFIEFKRILADVDKTVPESQREAIYRDIFIQVGIDLKDEHFEGLSPGYNAVTLNEAYQVFPAKRREINTLVRKLKDNPTESPVKGAESQ